ncbi:MAG: proteasome assembly chaperone family protein [Candidatus Aenigmarchaeota archaeon]|nr:proteasome assembly chaperone family protein [Candidatus Aenigmarchaeota archaeon]
MKTHIKVLEKVRLKKPIFIQGLPGIGNVGRVAAGYLVSELKMKKFAELYSQHFLPLVLLHDDAVASPLRCEFYYCRGKSRDIVVLTGDSQSVTSEGHYEISGAILDFIEGLGVKEVITMGGFAEGKEVSVPRVIGAVTDKSVIKKYGKMSIDFGREHQIGTIVGASGLVLGLSGMKGMEGLCLMGETVGLPVMTDPKAADAVLHILVKILNLKLDLSKLEKIVMEMEEKISRTDEVHKKMMAEMGKQKEENVRYIG